ncbi:MAG TPA: hypothetical protein VJG32_21900 [Anaerolineae bacterium]|nr:hypothetical protein [Anaerolineae bacterium]
MHEARWRHYLIEWLIIVAVALAYSSNTLLDFNANQLQQTGEHNESATLPLLAEIGLKRYGEIPLWNPYMLTGFPHVGDLINHFWNPVATVPVLIWGGINGLKVSVFLAFILAGIGQWLFAHGCGVRGLVRLWAALLFMLSGGLAMLWQVGWYELLLGMAFFPWCFASLWWALRRRDRASLALTAVCVAMVLSTGGGYYPFYVCVSLGVLVGMSLLTANRGERWPKLRRTATIALLSAALLAVMLLPIIDGYRYTFREAGPDPEQDSSQPILYALFNYVVSDPQWARAGLLGMTSGWSWFYIGALPLIAALGLTPLVFSLRRHRRRILLSLAVLTLIILAWHANRHTPVRLIYDWIPFLYNLRFPSRLLILAASPLIVLGGLGLQFLFAASRLRSRGSILTLSTGQGKQPIIGLPLRWLPYGALSFVMLLSIADVYAVNKSFAFAPRPRNAKAAEALSWLKAYDPSLYYTNLGGGAIFWDWVSAAYEREMPIINFDYGRRLATFDAQRRPDAPFFATAKYLLAQPDQPRPENAELLRDFDGVGLWYLPDALPFAFSAPLDQLAPPAKLSAAAASPLDVSFDGPNRVIVKGAPAQASDHLVILVSDYPGWRLEVDGQAADVLPANGYLGAAMLPGEHTYTFAFQPMSHYAGLAISILAVILTAAWIVLAKSPLVRV